MSHVRVKICCISSIEEADTAVAFGASALGLVGAMPSGPGIITDQLIRSIAETTPPGIGTFLLTSETRVDGIVGHHQRVFTNTIQIVDELSEGSYGEIRAALPGVKLVQVIHVIDEASVEEAVRISAQVDAILLDSGNPNLPVKELGGTGRTHDWRLSRNIREQIKIPLFLAGGLHAENVQRAVDQVQPYGVDLCSGVRSAGKLDARKLEAFFNAVV